MVPDQGGDIGFLEQRSDRRRTSLKREFSPPTEIENTLLRIGRGWLGMEQPPAAIKNGLPKLFRHIDGRQIGGTKCRYE